MAKHGKKAPERIVVDGIEGNQARIEQAEGETKDIEVKALPKDATEGDILKEVDGKLEVDQAETARVQKEAQGKLDALNKAPASKEIDL